MRARLAGNVQAALGGHLLARFGHQAAVLRQHALAMPIISSVTAISRFMRVCSAARISGHVAILDMPPVLAQVQRDAVGAGLLRQQRRVQRVGIAAAARLAQRRDVIDVHAEGDAASRARFGRSCARAGSVRMRSTHAPRAISMRAHRGRHRWPRAAPASRRAASARRRTLRLEIRQRLAVHRPRRLGHARLRTALHLEPIVTCPAHRPTLIRSSRAPDHNPDPRAAASRSGAGSAPRRSPAQSAATASV